jgi:pimeloyl-ACP methyl ester carboxylesterase
MIAAADRALDAFGDIDPEVRQRLLTWLRDADTIDVDVALLGQFIQTDPEYAGRLAEALCDGGVLTRSNRHRCGTEECHRLLSDESLQEGHCQSCGVDLVETPPQHATQYVLQRARARDVGWVIAIHGIRTHGAWQEQLQWLIDHEYRVSVPFRNWKYGKITSAALIPSRQRALVRRFVDDVREAEGDLAGVFAGARVPPADVVAHSFGTWIVAHALQEEPELRLGRLVLVGSIVRPNWDWDTPLDRGQIQAVLNYCGDRDLPVKVAEWGIPDSGPSGVHGFPSTDPRLFNVIRPGGQHSTAFEKGLLVPTFEAVWQPFLADRFEDADLKDHRLMQPDAWKAARRLLRTPL